MLKIEIMDDQEAGKNEIEDCLWEWTTAVEWRREGGQETEKQVIRWIKIQME